MTTPKHRSAQAEQMALVLDAMLEERERLVSKVEAFIVDGAKTKKLHDDLVDKTTSAATTPVQEELDNLDRQMVVFINQHRPLFRRWFGRTVKLPHGVIKWFNGPVSLLLPKDKQGVVKTLLARRGGKKHLHVKYEPNVSSLTWADRRTLRAIGARRQAFELLQLNRVDSDGKIVGGVIELQRLSRPIRRASDED